MTNDFGFTRDSAEARSLKPHLNELPRSVVRPDEYELLDGEWRFAVDLDDVGLGEKWQLGHDYDATAHWPGSIEAHMAEAKGRQQQQHGEGESAAGGWTDQVIAWYERDFTVPENWARERDRLVQVTFGACGYETRAWLNGHLLHTVEGEDVHYGEYTSFSYELPPECLRPDGNRLTVRIADSLDAEIPRGKQQSTVYKRGGIWYQTYTGAVRSVWVEPIGRNRLRSRVNVISSFRDRFVAFDLTTRVHDPGNYTLRLAVTARGAPPQQSPLSVADFALPLEAGEKTQRVPLELPDAQLWSPQEPNLYTLVAQLIGPAGAVSQIETNFGLRNLEARGRAVYLNNEAIYLDGILYQPGTAAFDEMRRHMLAAKLLGCNLVRVHIAGVDPRIYALADELGLLLWVEVPSPHSSSQRSRDNHRAEMMRMLVHTGSHPSVVIWSLYNEDWGVQDIATNAETRRYIIDTYNYMRLNYPQVLVVDNDGWRHVSSEGRLKSDLYTVHIYTPDVERWRDLLDQVIAGQNEGVTAEALVVGDPFFYRGQVPAVISEWGGFGFVGYGGPDQPDAKSERIRAFKREMRRRTIAGDVYTQAVSIEDEDNGLIDPRTGELMVEENLLNSRDDNSDGAE